MDQVRHTIRLKNYSYRTEQAYVQWIRRYIFPGTYIPADVTLLWQGIVDTLATFGLDLRGIPAPATGDLTTQLLLLDGLTG